MENTAGHWDTVYKNKHDNELGWYEQDLNQTFKFIHNVPLLAESPIFIAGAGTSTLISSLDAQGYLLSVNDISEHALKISQSQLPVPDKHNWIRQSIAEPLELEQTCELWIDRAVLHFLISADAQHAYFENVRRIVKPGGYILLAQFSEDGAKTCAGLPVKGYSVADYQAKLADFKLIASERYVFINPFGQARPYNYVLFKRLK